MAIQALTKNALPLAVAALLLAGCGGNTIPDPEPEETVMDGSADSMGEGDFDEFGRGEEVPYDPYAEELSTTIYFDFDSYEVRADDAELVNRHSIQILDTGASVDINGGLGFS